MTALPRVTIWNEGRHEKTHEEIRKVYPNGMHAVIADGLKEKGLVDVRTATLDDDEQHGLSDEVLNTTDVLFWWGHMAHHLVNDSVVERVYDRIIHGGMGLVVLHSAHFSKIFRKLMGTSCDLKWRDIGERERLWVTNPAHPIAAGIGEYITLEHEEMYGEHFDIPAPDEQVFISWFEGGDVFRSGSAFYRGAGKVFYFRPGHEAYPTFYQADIKQVMYNAALWAAPSGAAPVTFGHRPEPIEKVNVSK